MASFWLDSEWQTRNMSTPAFSERTIASPRLKFFVIAPISMSSMNTAPLKPKSFFRKSTTNLLIEAGMPRSTSEGLWSSGTRRCPTMIAATSFSIALSNGGISVSSRRARLCLMTGMSTWLSWEVSPCPGKCFAQAATPSSWMDVMNAPPSSPTSLLLELYDRSPMTGFLGLESTSSTGARSMSTFTALSSAAITFAILVTAPFLSSQDAILLAEGMSVKLSWLVSLATFPPSWSVMTRSLRPCASASSFMLEHRDLT
mmetsp:Transcript_20653/g.43670  ORF Transcript_20653/g.43670 Transcript_20653/m.43670 type:complete len:258 (-) Transcript_20653:147-920(-)